MPQEFLRDVLRTGDTKGRRRRLSVLPISIAIHAIVLTVFLFSPWLIEGELPIVGYPLQAHYMETVPPPAPPAPSALVPTPTKNPGAPTEAPDKIAEETPEPVRNGPAIEGALIGPPVEAGSSLLIGLSAPPPTVEPPPPPAPTKPLKISGGIREPKKLVHVAPIYPEIARLSRVEGKVTMEAILDATGRVESVRVLSAEPLLQEAAVRAVKQWRYTPTELNGVPVPVLMTITVVFTLQR